MRAFIFKMTLIIAFPINILSAQSVDEIKESFPSRKSMGITEEPIYTRAERMPIYPGCESITTISDQEKCTESGIINFILENLINPTITKDELYSQGFSTKVFLTFVISKDGEVNSVEIIKGAHPKLNKAAKESVGKLPKMIPGTQGGIPINIKLTYPVQFHLK